jgi:hypothetical protein
MRNFGLIPVVIVCALQFFVSCAPSKPHSKASKEFEMCEQYLRSTDSAVGLKECRECAAKNVPMCQLAMGLYNSNVDLDSAKKYLTASAKNGNPIAAGNLFSLYQYEKKNDSASYWKNMAILKGYQQVDSSALESPQLYGGIDSLFAYDGSWETSKVRCVYSSASDSACPAYKLKIKISGDSVEVYMPVNKDWKLIDRKFIISKTKSNAVLFNTKSGWDFEGEWVETWNITLTKFNKNKMGMHFIRQVNNLHLPTGTDHSKFSFVNISELEISE